MMLSLLWLEFFQTSFAASSAMRIAPSSDSSHQERPCPSQSPRARVAKTGNDKARFEQIGKTNPPLETLQPDCGSPARRPATQDIPYVAFYGTSFARVYEISSAIAGHELHRAASPAETLRLVAKARGHVTYPLVEIP